MGPANEELLRQSEIHRLDDLHRLFNARCNGDAQALAKFLLVGARGAPCYCWALQVILPAAAGPWFLLP